MNLPLKLANKGDGIMAPKKKSMSGIIVAALFLLLTVFLALHGAGAYSDIQDRVNGAKGFEALSFYTSAFEARVSTPAVIEWTEHSRNWLFVGAFIWFIVVAYVATSKRNTIAGKEHGTAKWGNPSNIKDLLSASILKREIKKAKSAKYFISRIFAKRRVVKECKADGAALKAQLLKALNESRDRQKENGSFNKRLYKEDKKKLDAEVKSKVNKALIDSWEPFLLKKNLRTEAASINEKYKQGFYTLAEKKRQAALCNSSYKGALKKFYQGKGKIKGLKEQYADADAILTDSERISIHNLKLNNNILILGGSGSGKTRGFVLPNILQAHSSFVVTDPKGEILEKAGHFLKNVKGYDVRVLNLDNKALSDGYNPFAYIHPERDGYEERVLMLIEAIIINTDGGEKKGGSDPFWDKAEKLFLQAIFFFTCDGFVVSERNMNTVLSLIGMLQIAEDEDRYDSDLDCFAKIFERLHGSGHIGVQQYKEFRTKASGKTAKSIVISAVARLAPFRTAGVRKLFGHDSMGLDMLGEKKMAVFVIVPPTDTTFNFIAGMLFTQMFQELQHCATEVHKHDGQRLPVPVRFILDEFANTCTIPNFVKILAYARSFGIGIVPILQSLEQIKNMYKDEWGVVVDNCNTLLFLGRITHMDTLEYMSKLLGKGTFDKKTTGRTRSKHGSSSQNWDVVGRELMDVSEIRKLPNDRCLLVFSGRDPFYSKKYEYTSHPNYRHTSDGNSSLSFHFEPSPIPELQRDAAFAEGNAPAPDVPQAAPSANSVVDIEEISISFDSRPLLNYMGNEFNHLVPVPDEDLSVDDGEDALSDEQIDELFNALIGKEADEEANKMLSLSAYITEEMEELANNEIQMTVDPISTAACLGRLARDLLPIPNDELSVDDGEPALSEGQTDMIVSALEDADCDAEGLDDLLAQSNDILGDVINSLIDSLPPELRETFGPMDDRASA